MSTEPEKTIRDIIDGAEEYALPEARGEAQRRGQRMRSDVLLGIADRADPFHSSNGKLFADIIVNGHRETWPIRSPHFADWLRRSYFEETRRAPPRQSLETVLEQLEAKAIYGGPQREVFVRVARVGENTYLDLADPDWRAVEVTQDGWRIVDKPPVRFLRAPGMLPLPCPDQNGSIDDLRPFINVRTEYDFVLISSWLLAAIGCRGPYPVLVLFGEKGSAKSTTSTLLRTLIDPNHAPLRSLPRNEQELFIAATHAHVLAFDNVSNLKQWQSDAFCRIATGGGHSVRRLYTDEQEVLYSVRCPLILNGIDSFVTRDDLADRCIFLITEPILRGRRLPEAQLWAEFNRRRPRILGALLNGLVHALRRLPRVETPELPRLADYGRLSIASEPSLWPVGAFEATYAQNRDEAVQVGLETDPVARALLKLVIRTIRTIRTTRIQTLINNDQPTLVFNGTASDLVTRLQSLEMDAENEDKLPRAAAMFSDRLTRATPVLRELGITVERHRDPGPNRTRIIQIFADQKRLEQESPADDLHCEESEVSLDPCDEGESSLDQTSESEDGRQRRPAESVKQSDMSSGSSRSSEVRGQSLGPEQPQRGIVIRKRKPIPCPKITS